MGKVLCEGWKKCSNTHCTHWIVHEYNISCENDCGHDIEHNCVTLVKTK